jgi:hypothetical protein
MKNPYIINETKTYQLGFLVLILFCLFRPITMLDFNIRIAGVNLLEIFAISISYLFLVAVVANVRNLKIDLVLLTMMFFCFYCVFSILWGSEIREVLRIVLPFVIFFSVRLFIKNPEQINLLLSIMVIAYLIPLFGSLFDILLGNSAVKVEYLTGVERHSGVFKAIHALANTMFFFSAFFYLKYFIFRPENRYIRYALIFLLIASIYCLVKTYARSAFLGFFIFWSIALFGYDKKKYFFCFLILSLSVGIFYQSNLKQIFFKTAEVEEADINTASSGRAFLWEHNIRLFLNNYSFDEKLLGRGIGTGTQGVFGKENEIWSSHNDYLHLLMHSGVIGLFLYLLIHVAILKDILLGKIEKKLKYFYLGIIFSIIVVNFVSGIITYTLPTAQLFWMVMGFYYILKPFLKQA